MISAPRLIYGWVSKGRQSFSSRPQSNSEWDYRNITSNTTSTPIYGWVFRERKFVTSLTAPSGYDYRNASSVDKSAPVYGWVSKGRQQVSVAEYNSHNNKPPSPSVGSYYYSNGSPVYKSTWVSTPSSIEVEVTLSGNLNSPVELRVANVPGWLEAGFDRGDGSGLTDGIEFDLRQENRLTTKLVLRPVERVEEEWWAVGNPEFCPKLMSGSYEIKVLATSGNEARVETLTLNVTDSWQVEVIKKYVETGTQYVVNTATVIYLGPIRLEEAQDALSRLTDWAMKWAGTQAAGWGAGKVVELFAGKLASKFLSAFGGALFELLANAPLCNEGCRINIDTAIKGHEVYLLVGISTGVYGGIPKDVIIEVKSLSGDYRRDKWLISKDDFPQASGVFIITLNDPIKFWNPIEEWFKIKVSEDYAAVEQIVKIPGY